MTAAPDGIQQSATDDAATHDGTPHRAASHQDTGHPHGHDYEPGSPHLRHAGLRTWIIEELRAAVLECLDRQGTAWVLEVGAGHGSFTDHLVAAGAQVVATEMSRASATALEARFRHNDAARVVFDADGAYAQRAGETFDIVVCASVLHHIPDYLGAIASWVPLINPGGAFLAFQDPMWFPRRSRLNLGADRGAYYAWRLGRGDLTTGLRSFTRRRRNKFDEAIPNDMVEYHALRQGCDEEAVRTALAPEFAAVDVVPYWSTQSPLLQAAGARFGLTSTFAVRATGRLPG